MVAELASALCIHGVNISAEVLQLSHVDLCFFTLLKQVRNHSSVLAMQSFSCSCLVSNSSCGALAS